MGQMAGAPEGMAWRIQPFQYLRPKLLVELDWSAEVLLIVFTQGLRACKKA